MKSGNHQTATDEFKKKDFRRMHLCNGIINSKILTIQNVGESVKHKEQNISTAHWKINHRLDICFCRSSILKSFKWFKYSKR